MKCVGVYRGTGHRVADCGAPIVRRYGGHLRGVLLRTPHPVGTWGTATHPDYTNITASAGAFGTVYVSAHALKDNPRPFRLRLYAP